MKSRTKWSTPRGPGGYSCPCCTPGRPRSWKCRDRRTKRRQERARYYEVAEVNREAGEVPDIRDSDD